MTAPAPLFPPGRDEGPPAGALVLGAYLRALRRRVGLSLRQASLRIHRSAAMLSRYEMGICTPTEQCLYVLLRAYGLSTREDFEEARCVRRHAQDHVYRDAGGWLRGRVEAVEATALSSTVFTCSTIPPTLYSRAFTAYRAQADGGLLPPPRPRPCCPVTLFVEELVLGRPYGGPAVMAAQLRYWADLSDSGDLEIRVMPPVDVPPQAGLLSELELPGNRRIWIDEDWIPAFSTGTAARSRAEAVQRARETALSADSSLNVLHDAAEHWATAAAASSTRSTACTR
ncbi:Scr1 family TA system antitoxin-like transcriptional regulator [Streptomyces sp. NPDC048340]|uniref:Scr1 family TA system antitoxin-like transcriptional regulator n=1 Tax=Streptomyces sp. NPDC048340 TaxID=3365537 RepID=UPI003719BF6D